MPLMAARLSAVVVFVANLLLLRFSAAARVGAGAAAVSSSLILVEVWGNVWAGWFVAIQLNLDSPKVGFN